MGKRLKDKRLPSNLHVFQNDFCEFVVCIGDSVFQFPDGRNAVAGRTVDQAVEHYFVQAKENNMGGGSVTKDEQKTADRYTRSYFDCPYCHSKLLDTPEGFENYINCIECGKEVILVD